MSQIIPKTFDGLWRSRGYGLFAEISAGEIQLIEHTKVSCLPTTRLPIDRFTVDFGMTVDAENETFNIIHDGTLSTITFERQQDDPYASCCPKGVMADSKDPALNFEILWHTFDEHYAFFSERRIDWQRVRTKYRSQIEDDMDEEDLEDLFTEILELLEDAHVCLDIDDEDVVDVDSRLDQQIAEEYRQRGKKGDVDDYLDRQIEKFDNIIQGTYLNSRCQSAFLGEALWGQINDEIGYFRIDSMEGLARGDYDSSLADLLALRPVLNAMLQDLGHLPSMIVDVRMNGGGHDTVALSIAARFADKIYPFGAKQAYANGTWTMPQDLVLTPSEEAGYTGKVAVLIGPETASAAEVFTLAMRALPQTTLIGGATAGVFSDGFCRCLPNGWELELSNEAYRSSDGELFEVSGIPPDIKAPMLQRSDLKKRFDPGIEAAIAALKDRE